MNEPRPEIDGLRAVAVLLVLFFHVGVPGASGGFVGVDVFFVISGFLISRSLLDEACRTQGVALAAFWARRMLRLLPAASLVLAATALGSLVWLSPLTWRTLAGDLAASACYVSNLAFLRRANGYFDADVTSSPLLHTWSLGVEEQFYLLWPLLVLAGARFAARTARAPRRVLAASFAAVTLASFALSLAQLRWAPAWAYFGSPARAWQLGCGALLAFAPLEHAGARLRKTLGATGAVLLGAAVWLVDERTPYPGWAALLPVSGAVASIAAGARSPTGRALSAAPLRWLGRLSYSIYLWHWPLIVFANAATSLGLAGRALAGVLSVVLAQATQRWVENPPRFDPRLAPPRRSLALGGALAALGVTVAATVGVAELRARHAPALARLFAAQANRSGDEGGNECGLLEPAALRERCSFGPIAGVPVLLLGDSHAQHWTPALEPIARELAWRITYAGRGGCPSLPVRVTKHFASAPAGACVRWQDDVPRLLGALRPRWLIVANSDAYLGRIVSPAGEPLALPAQAAAWRAGAAQLAREASARGIRLLWLLDTPRLPSDPLDCLARGGSPAACTPSRRVGTTEIAMLRAQETAALAADERVAVFDPLPLLCDARACPVERDGQLVFRDSSHLTANFARSLAPALGAFVRDAVGREQPGFDARALARSAVPSRFRR